MTNKTDLTTREVISELIERMYNAKNLGNEGLYSSSLRELAFHLDMDDDRVEGIYRRGVMRGEMARQSLKLLTDYIHYLYLEES